MRRLAVLLLALAGVLGAGLALPEPAAAQRGPRLITDLSQSRIDIEYTFAGADILLFGAIDRASSLRNRQLDLVVVVRGPSYPLTVRKKERVAGVWLNTRSVRFQTAPSYYALSSTRPVSELVDEKTAAIYEFGIKNLHFSPASTERSAKEIQEFQQGLVELRQRRGLYVEDPTGVRVVEGVLFRARTRLPGDAPVGEYTASVFLVSGGDVIATTSVPLTVGKTGFEQVVYNFAVNHGLAYGLLAVVIALASGWGVAAIMKR
ncbi:TIGR02186 family protein [Pedomonas mirosovicensis]|uniref:TIGR02186 family protein n=1 Tax=Pedomonas mirosovicensis TaxID=2908641 RepID=UPI0021689D7D|nr:TIGR02186 family protein [Pedomonas mirosovicensis]MCH8684248.1 TIGR02186 family protein [Pedomonas mirosovicensis]